jgi:hypothetical protein
MSDYSDFDDHVLPSIEVNHEGLQPSIEDEAGNVEPHDLIKQFERKFNAEVKCYLNEVRSDIIDVPQDLQELCAFAKPLVERGMDRLEIKAVLMEAMDDDDFKVELTSRAGKVGAQLQFISKGDLAYWETLLEDLEKRMRDNNWRKELPQATDSEILEHTQKQAAHVLRVRLEVQHDLALVQKWPADKESMEKMFVTLRKEACLLSGDVYPLKSDRHYQSRSPGDHTGSSASGSVSYTYASVRESRAGSIDAASGEDVSMSRDRSLADPSTCGRGSPPDASENSITTRQRSVEQAREPHQKLTGPSMDEQLAGLGMGHPLLVVPGSPPSRLSS